LAGGTQFSLPAGLADARTRAAQAAAEMSEQLLRGGGAAALATQKRISRTFAGYFWMLVVMFGVGILAFIAAVIRGFTASDGSDVAVSAVFGGLSATSFVTAFLTRPVDAMGRAGPSSAWLLAIVNTYWSKLAYFTDAETIVADLDQAQKVLNRDLISYLKHTGDSSNEPKPPPATGGGTPDGSDAPA
jgi:hypothetical protein